MTPRLFAQMLERFREEQKRQDRRAGGVIAMLYNINRDGEKDPNGLDWWDFFTEWKEPVREPEEQTEEEMFQIMKLFAAAHPEGLSN